MQRPSNTCSTKELIIKRVKTLTREITKSKMTDQCQYRHAKQIFPIITSMMISFCHKEKHDWSCQSSYRMQKNLYEC